MKHPDELSLFEYARGESLMTETERHLLECGECGAAARREKQLVRALRWEVEYSEEFQQRLMARLPESPTVRTNRREMLRSWLFPALQFALAVSLLTLHFIMRQQVDVSQVLLAAMPSTSAAEDLSPGISDVSLAFGIPLSGS
jgi:hypothetical protein